MKQFVGVDGKLITFTKNADGTLGVEVGQRGKSTIHAEVVDSLRAYLAGA